MKKGALENFFGIVLIFIILIGYVQVLEWKQESGVNVKVDSGWLQRELTQESPYTLLPILQSTNNRVSVLERLIVASQKGNLQETIAKINEEISKNEELRWISLYVRYTDSDQNVEAGKRELPEVSHESIEINAGNGILYVSLQKPSEYPEVGGGI